MTDIDGLQGRRDELIEGGMAATDPQVVDVDKAIKNSAK